MTRPTAEQLRETLEDLQMRLNIAICAGNAKATADLRECVRHCESAIARLTAEKT